MRARGGYLLASLLLLMSLRTCAELVSFGQWKPLHAPSESSSATPPPQRASPAHDDPPVQPQAEPEHEDAVSQSVEAKAAEAVEEVSIELELEAPGIGPTTGGAGAAHATSEETSGESACEEAVVGAESVDIGIAGVYDEGEEPPDQLLTPAVSRWRKAVRTDAAPQLEDPAVGARAEQTNPGIGFPLPAELVEQDGVLDLGAWELSARGSGAAPAARAAVGEAAETFVPSRAASDEDIVIVKVHQTTTDKDAPVAGTEDAAAVRTPTAHADAEEAADVADAGLDTGKATDTATDAAEEYAAVNQPEVTTDGTEAKSATKTKVASVQDVLGMDDMEFAPTDNVIAAAGEDSGSAPALTDVDEAQPESDNARGAEETPAESVSDNQSDNQESEAEAGAGADMASDGKEANVVDTAPEASDDDGRDVVLQHSAKEGLSDEAEERTNSNQMATSAISKTESGEAASETGSADVVGKASATAGAAIVGITITDDAIVVGKSIGGAPDEGALENIAAFAKQFEPISRGPIVIEGSEVVPPSVHKESAIEMEAILVKEDQMGEEKGPEIRTDFVEVVGNKGKRFAFVSMLTNDAFLPALMVLLDSLHTHSHALQSEPWKVKLHRVVSIPHPARDEGMEVADPEDVFTKLHVWRLHGYEKVVYLDADTMVMASIDELFGVPGNFSAAPDCCPPLIFNAGVLVLKPSEHVFKDLMGEIHSIGKIVSENGIQALKTSRYSLTTVYGDQELLNMYFKDWNPLKYTYNFEQATYAVDGRHSSNRRRMEVYTELQTTEEPQWLIKVFHFTGWKPWNEPERGGVYVDQAGQVSVRGCNSHEGDINMGEHSSLRDGRGGVVGECHRGCSLAGRYGWSARFMCAWWWHLAMAAERSNQEALRTWRVNTPALDSGLMAIQMFLSADLFRPEGAACGGPPHPSGRAESGSISVGGASVDPYAVHQGKDTTDAKLADCTLVPFKIFQLQAWRTA